MMLRGFFIIAVILISATASFGQMGIDDIYKRLGLKNQNSLSDSKITAGLKEALQVGANNTVKLNGQQDGYFGNEAIKIHLPKKFQAIEKGLRAVGYGPKIDSFVLSMNRSAEKAAPAAKKIFIDAILDMSFEDARKILCGKDTAATEYFKAKTSEKLIAAFTPIVEKTMDENHVTQQYKAISSQVKRIPLMKSPDLDIMTYVASKALDGLFFTLGQEEIKIRKDPIARTSRLLKEVFGK